METSEYEEVKEVEYTPTLIKDMLAEDRPREKALKSTVHALTDAELMALVFGTGIKGKSVIELCQDILKDNNYHLSRIADMNILTLKKKYKGIGLAKATNLLACLELGARAERDRLKVQKPKFLNSEDGAVYMRPRLAYLQHEEFWVVLINRAGMLIDEIQISKGGTAATTVDVKLIMKAALENLASALILYHNHPSGTLQPSPEDLRLTTKIQEAARFFDIRVLDHFIITANGYYSFADHQRL